MKLLVFLLPLFMLTTLATAEEFKTNSAADFFKGMKIKILEKLPDTFTAELTGRSIKDKLNTIPKNYISTNNTNVFVEISFTKQKGFLIEVRNVSSYYIDMYQDYARFLNLGIASPNLSNDAITARYNISFKTNSPDIKILRLQVKNAEDSTLLYVDPTSYQIMRYISTIFTFEDVVFKSANYSIINRLLMKRFKPQESRPDIFEIKNIKVK